MSRLLIVEDEPNARETLGEVFRERYEVELAGDVDEAENILASLPVDLVLTDIVLPGERDGLDLVRHMKIAHPAVPVLIMTAYGSVEKAVRAMRDGAYDFLEKPLDLRQLRQVVSQALRDGAVGVPQQAGLPATEATLAEGYVGRSPAIRDVFRIVAKAAPTNATVLILGESGTGKEPLAAALHRASPRRGGPFVKVNCAALAEGLLESELFGHAKGSFTGALADREGRFEAARGGTLFLDEVGEIPSHTQVKLLRVLQSREIERVGETRTRPIDVRLVAATNADLEALVRKGTFREDFYFRLKVVVVRVPPLRERRSDIPLLVEHFRRLHATRHGLPLPEVSPAAMALLESYDWPGNVRELENALEAAVVLCEGKSIEPSVLPETVGGAHVPMPMQRDEDGLSIPTGTSLPEAERRIVLDTLRRVGGNKTEAARILQIGLRTLYRKLEQYGEHDTAGDEGGGSA